MDFPSLLAALSRPEAYPHPTGPVEVRQTHISAVLLAGPYAYKIKKPLDLGFLDFTTLESRLHFCREEVRLNRRLAPRVYLGVVPVTASGGRLRVRGAGEVVDWAVWMERLPDEASLAARVARGEVLPGLFERIGREVADFHAAAEGGAHVSLCGRWEVVAANARENFSQSAGQVGRSVHPEVFERLARRTGELLERHRALIEARAAAGVPRDTHGDLHLDHVYYLPERRAREDLVAVDCVEFNERFRYADPIADAAFLYMDLRFAGRRDLARVFADAYFARRGDAEGRALLDLYSSYRAAVRAKVDGIEVAEVEVPEPERGAAFERARAHWLLALGEAEAPARRPCLLLLGGLPGSGKSTLARALAREAGCELVASDRVRKELAGLPPETSGAAPFGEGLYSAAWNERTYRECARRAEALLFAGRRVVVDATFRDDARRRTFGALARGLGVPGVLLLCRASRETVRQRLGARAGDVSDADWAVYEAAEAAWVEPAATPELPAYELRNDGGPEVALARALGVLEEQGLAAP